MTNLFFYSYSDHSLIGLFHSRNNEQLLAKNKKYTINYEYK